MRAVTRRSMAGACLSPRSRGVVPQPNRKETIMTQQPTLLARKPTHRLYNVTGEGKSANWTEIGAAWPNKDGHGFSVTCEAIPLKGRIVMREITERPAAEGAAA